MTTARYVRVRSAGLVHLADAETGAALCGTVPHVRFGNHPGPPEPPDPWSTGQSCLACAERSITQGQPT